MDKVRQLAKKVAANAFRNARRFCVSCHTLVKTAWIVHTTQGTDCSIRDHSKYMYINPAAHQRCHVTSMAVLNAWTSVSSLPAMYVLGLRSVSLPLVALNLPQQYWYDTDQKC